MTGFSGAAAEAARGIFLGAAVGDALGWPQEARGGIVGGQRERDSAIPLLEFREWTRHAGHYSSRYQDLVRPGEYSDDTQLLLATARACLAGDHWQERLTSAELPAWPLYQRGGGGAVLSAAASWADGRPPWRADGSARAQATQRRYRGAGANGVAMRIAPHVLRASDGDDLIRRVVGDGIMTHGHPRALVGALVYAFALFHAASSNATHGYGVSAEAASAGLVDADQILPAVPADWGSASDIEAFAALWETTNREASELLALVAESLGRGAMSNPEATLESLGCTDPAINGSGTVSAAAAVYLASRFAARPQDGLLTSAFLRKADTDTLASLTSAILGALHGTQWLQGLADSVQDADYIVSLAERTVAPSSDPPPWPTQHPGALRRALAGDLLNSRSTEGEFPDGRQYRLKEISMIRDDLVLRARLRLADGQTVIVDLRSGHDRGDNRDRPPRPQAQAARAALPPATGNGRHPAAHHAPAETGVILCTRSLARSAVFYAQLTGRNIPVRGGTAEIGPGLLLQQAAEDEPIDVSSVIVSITVDSLPSAMAGLPGVRPPAGPDTVVEINDPDGRVVRVAQRPESSRRDH